MTVRTGLDAFLSGAGRPWRGKRLGLIVHQASVTADLVPAPRAMAEAGFRAAALFAPEHGLHGALQDQVAVGAARDARLKVPVHSLYGDPAVPAQFARLSPAPAALKGLDALVFDLQDVGVRYYTFVWTMTLAMAAARRAGIPFIVLDRPNPLGGVITEGNLPDPRFLSFVGLYPVPARHGLTAGELARHVNAVHGVGADLSVVPLRGWRREMRFGDTGLPWVAPSPNMPTPDTAAVYAGGCLIEGTNLSEGRGTTRPFEWIGAPYVDGERLAEALNARRLPGVRWRPCGFRPSFHKWAGEDCGGVQAHVTDAGRFSSFLAGLALVSAVRRFWPRAFRWKAPPYEFVTDRLPFDLLAGGDQARRDIDGGRDPLAREPAWRRERSRFWARARAALLYPEKR